MDGASGDVHSDDLDGFAPILYQWGLHDTDQHLTIGRNGEAFHAFVGNAARRVAADLYGTHRTQVGNGTRARQRGCTMWRLSHGRTEDRECPPRIHRGSVSPVSTGPYAGVALICP